MKKIFLMTFLMALIHCFAQNNNKTDYFTLLTNDSIKYWDCVSYNHDTGINFGMCFDKSKQVFIYEYFRWIKFQRVFHDYLSQIYNYRISNDTMDVSYTNAKLKIEYISKDSLVLSYYNCCKGLIEIYKPSPDQQSRPMPVDYWYEIYKDAIKNNRDTLIYKKP